MKTHLRISLIFTFILMISLNLYAQDQIIKRDGTVIEGKVSYSTNNYNDFIKVNNDEIDAKEVDRIIFGNGVELFSEKILYYNTNQNIEISKFALIELILDGDAQLYSYRGPNFDFALKVDGKISALQQLPPNTKTEQAQTYKVVLLVQLEECAPRSNIFQSRYDRKSLYGLVDRYNRCKRGEEIDPPIVITRTPSTKISFSLGVNHATHSIEARVNEFNNGALRQVGEIQQLHIPSNDLALDLFIHQPILNSENLFLQAGLGYRKFDFRVKTLDDRIHIDNLTQNEANIDLGINFKVLPNNKIVPEASLGVFYWVLINPKNLTSNAIGNIPVLSSESYKKSGLGLFYQLYLSYYTNDSWSFFLGLRQQIRMEDHIYTNEINETFLRRLYNDVLHLNFVLSFGASYSLNRD